MHIPNSMEEFHEAWANTEHDSVNNFGYIKVEIKKLSDDDLKELASIVKDEQIRRIVEAQKNQTKDRFDFDEQKLLAVLDSRWRSIEEIQQRLSIKYSVSWEMFTWASINKFLFDLSKKRLIQTKNGQYKVNPQALQSCQMCGDLFVDSISDGLCTSCRVEEQTPICEQIALSE